MRAIEQALNGIADSHCHYDDKAFDSDRDEILSGLLENENSPMDLVIHAATDEESSRFGISTAEKYERFYTSVGFHPECCGRIPENYTDVLDKLASSSEKIVAVGEVGLDYHYDGYDRDFQMDLLSRQIEFAMARELPIIFHCRDATADFMSLMRKYKPRGVVHCFSGSPETAEEIVSLGMYVGFTGLLTFKNAKRVKKSFAAVPLERILLETDCPYMAPEPFRGRRCTSDMIAYTAVCGAEIKETDPQKLIDAANRNTKELFRIK